MATTTRMHRIDRADVATAILALTPAVAAAAALLFSAWLSETLPVAPAARPTGVPSAAAR